MRSGFNYDVKFKPLEPTLKNNFVEIGTGEGKSVTLAIVSYVLAIFGFEVSIACYSDVLSQRDEKSFKMMTELLGFEKLIHYGTFNKLSERIINKEINIRKAVEAKF
ncbi:MAG: hypothetical protein Q8T08_16470 [Ignavibacteria bacterium]|nr:hypothetical protein [Ignavibacteria bacterium]